MTLALPPVDVLAVGAHPDDVELGCGGTVLALGARGRSVGILDLTRGEMGTRGTPEGRAREAMEAASILGARFRYGLDLGDGGLRTDRDAELAIVDVVRACRPTLVLAPLPEDRHPDHARAGALARDAAFYAGLRALETDASAHRPQQVVFYPASSLPSPSFLVDVSAVFERKLSAIRAFRSQFHDPASMEPETFISSPEFLQGIVARAQAYGRLANVPYAEAFVSAVPPLLGDPVAAFLGYEPGFEPRTPGRA